MLEIRFRLTRHIIEVHICWACHYLIAHLPLREDELGKLAWPELPAELGVNNLDIINI